VTRDFVRNCRTPVLIMPDDIPAHPYVVAMEVRDARAKGRSEHVSLERTQGANSSGSAPDTFFSQGASLGLRQNSCGARLGFRVLSDGGHPMRGEA